MSPVFPRDKASRLTTVPMMPSGFQNWGQSGKGQFRAFDNTGRLWSEVYPAINLNTQIGRALMAAINQSQREKIIWDIQHPHFKVNFGVGGGSPTISGADQTGATINIANGPIGVTGWLLYGDIIQFAGINLVFDVVGTVDVDGGGLASIPIHPPIFVGNSPSNGSAVGVDASAIFFKAVAVDITPPDIESDGIVMPGLTILWREQPSI